MSRYDDIINRSYEGSTTRNRMSLANRAAQFAPFAALTGHDDAINETARLTSEKIVLSQDEQNVLSQKLHLVLENITAKPYLTFIVFEADEMKSGGRYVAVRGKIKQFDEYENVVVFTDNRRISIENIISIEDGP